MVHTLIKRWFFCITILVTSLFTTAQAAKLEEVFNGNMLGVTQRYFESVAGIPIRKFKDTYYFAVERCNVQAFIKDEEVYALRLELTPRCQADLSSFGFNRSTHGLTFGYFTSRDPEPEAQYALDPSFSADCLMLCGNAYDRSVYAFWEGGDRHDFLEVLLEVKLVGDPAITAADKWRDYMQQQTDMEYITKNIFNCDDLFDGIAANYFENIKVDAITLGYDLFNSGIGCTASEEDYERYNRY